MSKICVEATQDEVSMEIENNDGDIHLFTAATLAKMLGADLTFDQMMSIKKDEAHPRYKEVKNLRELSKNVRYSSFNLGGSYRLQQTCAKKGLFFTLDECKTAIKAWREVHADIYRFQMQQIEKANSQTVRFPWCPQYEFGVIYSIAGAKHYLRKRESLYSKELTVQASEAMSLLWMQTEAMVMKKALILIQRDFDDHPEWSAEINNLAHDELNVSCYNKQYLDDVAHCVWKHMKECMEYYVKSIPVVQGDHTDVYIVKNKDGSIKKYIDCWLDK